MSIPQEQVEYILATGLLQDNLSVDLGFIETPDSGFVRSTPIGTSDYQRLQLFDIKMVPDDIMQVHKNGQTPELAQKVTVTKEDITPSASLPPLDISREALSFFMEAAVDQYLGNSIESINHGNWGLAIMRDNILQPPKTTRAFGR